MLQLDVVVVRWSGCFQFIIVRSDDADGLRQTHTIRMLQELRFRHDMCDRARRHSVSRPLMHTMNVDNIMINGRDLSCSQWQFVSIWKC